MILDQKKTLKMPSRLSGAEMSASVCRLAELVAAASVILLQRC